MKFEIVKAGELTPEDVSRWRGFQDADASLASPYFCPEFTQAVAAERNDVYVARIEADGEVAGFFPFQRRRFGMGGPVGGSLCDYHGVIARQGLAWRLDDLMRGCGLVAWEFHALVASQEPFAPHHAGKGDSHYLEVADGIEAYFQKLKEGGSSQPSRLKQARRQLERAHPQVEFIENIDDASLLDQLIEWKSKQYQAGGIHDNFSFPWVVRLLHRIRALRTEHFSGMLSVLKADGKIAALHFGMRSRTVWHWWFPRHNEEFAKFKPGILLIVAAADRASSIGVKRIDLGYGDEEFKLKLRNGGTSLARGRVEIPSATMTLLRSREGLERWLKASPLYRVARIPGRLLTRLERWYRFR